jgi:hypothetical protein
MDACSDPALETVIFMSSSQVGKALDHSARTLVPAGGTLSSVPFNYHVPWLRNDEVPRRRRETPPE